MIGSRPRDAIPTTPLVAAKQKIFVYVEQYNE
jgi:hypothetical protein